MIEKITRELESRYHCRLTQLTGGYTNMIFLMEGTEPLLVAKVTSLSNQDTFNEINALRLLRESGIFPVVHDMLEIYNMNIILMDYKLGVHGQSVLDSERVVKNYNVMGVAKASLEAIRINAISSGPIRSLSAKGVSGFNNILSTIEEKSPLRRNVDQDEVGDAVLFLISYLSRGITGEVLHVDAGYHVIGI